MVSPVVGTIMLVALAMTQFAVALTLMPNFDRDEAPPLRHGGVWDNCELHDSDKMPSCSRQTGLIIDPTTDQPNCHVIQVTVYVGHGAIEKVDQLICEVLRTVDEAI